LGCSTSGSKPPQYHTQLSTTTHTVSWMELSC